MSAFMDYSLPPSACAECQLGHFAVYGPTRDATPDELCIRRRGIREIAAHKTLMREGETIKQIFTLYSGWAFRFKQLPEGKQQILSFLIPGDAIILESLCIPSFTLPFSVQSLTRIVVCIFDLQDMIDMTKGMGAQSQNLIAMKRDYVLSLNQRLTDIGRKSAFGRVAQLILELEERLRSRYLSENGRSIFRYGKNTLRTLLA